MRLGFFFMQESSGSVDAVWDRKVKATNKYVQPNGLPTEGYFYILKKMLEHKIIDEVYIVIESNRGPGYIELEGIPTYVIPNMKYAEQLLRPDDVLWIRGGFRTWFVYLEEWKKRGHWLILYAANTGRSRWTIWDIVFDDITGKNRFDKHNRFFYYFKKPINPDIFKLMKVDEVYDLCIGSSYIHDRKAQWVGIKAVIEYEKIFKKKLKCVMPGAFRHSTNTNEILNDIKKYNLSVDMPGMLDRKNLCKVYNQSKVFINMGVGGQNDRGPLEAMSCGCKLIVASTKNRAPFTYDNENISTLINEVHDYKQIALEIDLLVDSHVVEHRKSVTDYFEKKSSFYEVILPEMDRLFSLIRKHPKPDILALKKEYHI